MTEVEAFAAACRATERTACEQWVRAQGISSESPEYEVAKERWHTLPLLAEAPRGLAERAALAGFSASSILTSTSPFPAMIWYGGATDTRAGYRFKGTIADFLSHVLIARAAEIAPKRQGWVVTPTTSRDGHRTNASTVSMHALNLDCDGRGRWEKLLAVLDEKGAAYIAYESGGASPTVSKWHLLLPLETPFDTSSPEKIERWRSHYQAARVVFGTLAELVGEGFDPTVEAPSIPVFVTEKRSAEDAPRAIVHRYGRALALEALAATLPPLPREVERPSPRPAADTDADALANEDLEAIVAALYQPMSKILRSRRELYLALSGTLLDRAIAPDDVITIVEEISERCPGDPLYTAAEVASRHREHVHGARTTIAKWERGESDYTRIGSIAASWPEVAKAIDIACPDRSTEEQLEGLRKKHAAAQRLEEGSEEENAPTPPGGKRRRPGTMTRIFGALATRLYRSDIIDRKLEGFLLERLLRGEPFSDDVDAAQMDAWLWQVLTAVGFHAPGEISAQDVMTLITESVVAMDGGQLFRDVGRLRLAEKAFRKGQRKGQRWQGARQAAAEAKNKRLAALLPCCGKRRK